MGYFVEDKTVIECPQVNAKGYSGIVLRFEEDLTGENLAKASTQLIAELVVAKALPGEVRLYLSTVLPNDYDPLAMPKVIAAKWETKTADCPYKLTEGVVPPHRKIK